MSKWAVSVCHNSRRIKVKEEKSANCLHCFSTEPPDFCAMARSDLNVDFLADMVVPPLETEQW